MKKSSLVLSCFLLLAGCGSGRLTVMDPLDAGDFVSGVRVQQAKGTVPAEPEMTQEFETLLKEKLEEKGIKEGKSLTLSYRFIQINEGSRAARWFFGGIGNAGEGTLTVEVTYLNQNGKAIAKITSEGKISSGFGGGSFSNALEHAANEIAAYTAKALNIKKPEDA